MPDPFYKEGNYIYDPNGLKLYKVKRTSRKDYVIISITYYSCNYHN